MHFCQNHHGDIVLIALALCNHLRNKRFTGVLCILLCDHGHMPQHDLHDAFIRYRLNTVAGENKDIVIFDHIGDRNIHLGNGIPRYRACKHMPLGATLRLFRGDLTTLYL